jgi:hypothetical protein
MCDDKVFKTLPIKKNVKVELAGMYIVSVKGGKAVQSGKKTKKTKKTTKDTSKSTSKITKATKKAKKEKKAK